MCSLGRHDGHETNDGEVGCAKDSSGDEENDLGGDGGVSDTINYRDFVKMMLGKRSAVLKL